MAGESFDTARLSRMDDVLSAHAATGAVPGMAWAIARGDDVHRGVAGTFEVGGGSAVQPDTIFRISSMTKPVTAVAAMILVEECVARLDDPVDEFLPELANPTVVRTPQSPVDDTVPAERAITLRDLLTFRLGWGFDFSSMELSPTLVAAAEAGLGVGPPMPQTPPDPDEWIKRLSQLPLQHQPGARWLYHTGADVLGVYIARAAGRPVEVFLRERIFDPLGMKDTGFSVPRDQLARFGPTYVADTGDGERPVYDPADGQWATPPAFPSGGAGLVSTVPDYLSFARMLMHGGKHGRGRILSRPAVEAMGTDQLGGPDVGGPDPSGDLGWGFGVSVQRRRTGPTHAPGTYGWNGGLGSIWANDPAEGLIGVLMTNTAWAAPVPPPVCQDFWTCAYAALAD